MKAKVYKVMKTKIVTKGHGKPCFCEFKKAGFFVDRDKMAQALRDWRKKGGKIERVRK